MILGSTQPLRDKSTTNISWWSKGGRGPGSVVSITTGYVLDGPGIEYRWGRDFLHLCRPALGPSQPTV